MQGADRALSAIARALGDDAVLRDPDVRASYATDESEVPASTPAAVVRARSTEDVAAVMAAASEHRVPVTPRAGGTGRVGGAVPVEGGLVLSVERMDAVEHIERRDGIAVVQPGVVTGALHAAVEAEGLFYPPDPNSLGSCALGGNIAANAGGPRAFKYGVTRQYVLGLTVVLPDGTVVSLGRRTAKGVTGYDLTALMVGSEGTLGVVTEAIVRLIPKPESVHTLMVFLADDQDIAGAVDEALSRRIVPSCVELLDAGALDIVSRQAGLAVPRGASAMLLMELDGDDAVVPGQLETVGNALDDRGAVEVLVAQNASERERLWAARRELSHSFRKEAAFKLSEDVVVPRTKLAALLGRCRAIAEEHAITMPSYGHAGDGNLHVNFLWDDPGARPRVDDAIKALFEAVVQMGGTLSGEHGIGVLKAPYLPLEQSAALIALQERVKGVFDPEGIMNPGKIFPAAARRFHGAC
ncbi:MAG: FAD-binding protein [Myxococcales bacterium]|nr:FAD-binding protein [Myxococcales bacterium]